MKPTDLRSVRTLVARLEPDEWGSCTRGAEVGLYTHAPALLSSMADELERLRGENATLLAEADAEQHFATRALRAEAQLEALREAVRAADALAEYDSDPARFAGPAVREKRLLLYRSARAKVTL